MERWRESEGGGVDTRAITDCDDNATSKVHR